MDASFFVHVDGKKYSIEIETLNHRYFIKQNETRLHVQSSYHMVLVSEGSNMVLLKDSPAVHAEKNSLIFINPLVQHQFDANPKIGVEHTCLIWKFRDESGNYAVFPLQQMLGIDINACEPCIVKQLSEVDAKNFISKQREAERVRNSPITFSSSMCFWRLCFLGISLIWPELLQQSSHKLNATDKIVTKIKNFIDFDIGDSTLNIALIAKSLQRHPNYINSIFKKSEGETIGKYICAKRIELAKTLLVNTEFSISEIAEMCGFNQHSYFTRTFKQYCSMNPAKYRNKF